MKKHILISDDNDFMANIISKVLGPDFKTTTTNSALDALNWMYEGNVPDLIIADIEMPGLSGWDFLSKIRSSLYFKDVPVIILSSLNKSEERIKSIQLGADDFLMKPFNPEELIIRIKKILKTI